METAKIYVDLNSLFDTRQGALSSLLKAKELADLISSEAYNFRTIDEFSIDMEKFKEHYTEFSLSSFKMSSITYIVNVIQHKFKAIENKNAYTNESKRPELILNTYPLVFTERDAELIKDLIFIKMKLKVYISIISQPITEISPSFIKNTNTNFVFIYEFKEWIDTHLMHLQLTPLKDTVFFFPSKYYKQPTKEELEGLKKKGYEDPFSFMELIVSEYTKFQFLPIFFYSNLITATSYTELFAIEYK